MFFVDEVVRFVVLFLWSNHQGSCALFVFFVDEVVVGAKYKIN